MAAGTLLSGFLLPQGICHHPRDELENAANSKILTARLNLAYFSSMEIGCFGKA